MNNNLYIFLTREKFKFTLVILVTLLSSSLSALYPLALKYTFDGMSGDHGSDPKNFLYILVALFCAFRFIVPLSYASREYIFGRLEDSLSAYLRLAAFSHIQYLNHTFHLNKSSGELTRQFNEGISGATTILRHIFLSIVPFIIELVTLSFVVTTTLSFKYTCAIWIVMFMYGFFTVKKTNSRISTVRETAFKEKTISGFCGDNFMNHESVKFFGNEALEITKHTSLIKELCAIRKKGHLSLWSMGLGQALIGATGCAVVLLSSLHDISLGMGTIGGFIMLNTYLFQAFIPINILGFAYREMTKAHVDLRELSSLLQAESEDKSVQSTRSMPTTAENLVVSLNDLSFKHNNGKEVFSKLSLDIIVRDRIYLIGKSGAGKTTLIKLLFRLHQPSSGSIAINGIDIKHLSLSELRKNISIASQDTILFNDTIYNNIVYANPDVASETVNNVISLVGLSALIENLPNKEKTIIGERGAKLSGGEKQRIAVARAILKGANVIVFDEPTANLDYEAKHEVLALIKKLSEQYKIIVITHDTPAIKHDLEGRSYVIADGRIVPDMDTHYAYV